MAKNVNARALAPTLLFGGTLGTLIAVCAFGVARIADQMLEAVAVLPLNWGENHIALMAEISGGVAVPIVIWFVWWFYKKAYDAEAALTGYQYRPPQEPKRN